ncbi:hypothetical protein CLOP_g7399, partial [Closterium sp. NIES-67]
LLREWIGPDVTVLGGAGAVEEVLVLLVTCRRPHQAVSWFRRRLGAYPNVPPSHRVVRLLLQALRRRSMWHEMLDVLAALRGYEGFHDKANYSIVVRTLLHCRQPKLAIALFHEMLASGVLRCDKYGRVAVSGVGDVKLLQAVRHAAFLVEDREVLRMVGKLTHQNKTWSFAFKGASGGTRQAQASNRSLSLHAGGSSAAEKHQETGTGSGE